MDSQNKDFDLLCDDYLHGAMSEADKPEFEALLQSHPEHAAQWQEFCILTQGVREYGRRQMLETWYNEAHGKADDEKPAAGKQQTLMDIWKAQQKAAAGESGASSGKRALPIFRYISAAALMVIVFFVGWRLGNNTDPETGRGDDVILLRQMELPVVSIQTRQEDRPDTNAEIWLVRVEKNLRPESVSILSGRQLTLVLPTSEAPDDIRLRRLDGRVYIGMGGGWYPLRTDEQREQILLPVEDVSILSQLK